QVGQQPQQAGTTGQVGQQPQQAGTTGQVGQQPQQAGTIGQAGQQPQQAAGYPDPVAYAAWQQAVWQQAVWQQAVWQQQMAAQQAGQGYPYPHSAPPYAAASPAGGNDHETGSHHLKHDAHKYGQFIQMAEKFVNGETNIDDLINGLSGLDYQNSQFWRGILIGAGASLLFSSDMFSNGLAKLFQRSKTDKSHNNSQQQEKE
ncbi:MAG: hypothetical protein U9O82_08300, partial [Thermodesulfobacteriota bacterium]|nr:hypothetical protein [Thermodesulfobacteriota bacterium]